MQAIIQFGIPYDKYYNLPIFERKPQSIGPSFLGPEISKTIKNSTKNTQSITKPIWYLTFRPENGLFGQIKNMDDLDLTEEDILHINNGYFYLLDHQEYKGLTVQLYE